MICKSFQEIIDSNRMNRDLYDENIKKIKYFLKKRSRMVA